MVRLLKYMQGQWFAALLGVCVVSILYLGAVAVAQQTLHPMIDRVLGAHSPQTIRDSLSSRRLAFAPDVTLPQVVDDQAPVLYDVPTRLPVVFLTIDDGFYREPDAAKVMQDAHVSATLFLVKQYVNSTPGYFGDLARQTGSAIEDHTLDHKELTSLNFTDQKREICETADVFQAQYGRRPQLLRPPYGSYNDDTRRATAACGLRAVVHWRALVNNGLMHYQVGDKLRPGDIVLMHFTPNFKRDLAAFAQAGKDAGLTPQPLDAWIAH